MSPISESDLEELVLDELRNLGWSVVYGPDIAPGESRAERDDYRETVLVDRLRSAIVRLNRELPIDAVEDAIKVALRPESQVVMSENWRVYQLLLQGVAVDARMPDGSSRPVRVRLIDFDNPADNDFAAINQFTIQGKSERRPDVLLFVNGLPLCLMELKRPGQPNATLKGAFNQVRTYRNQIPDVFTWNQITVISDGVQARAGTFTAGWEHYQAWKTVDGANLADTAIPQIETLVHGMCEPARFLDLVRHFVVFTDEPSGPVKKVAKYHQYWAVNKAVERTIEAVEGDGRAGVVWHTQGSGKSLEMHCYAGKIMRNPAMANPTIVVLTDRNDLDDQLFDEVFAASRPGAPLPEVPVQATTRAHLKELLGSRQSGGIFFSTIQKFGLSKDERDEGTSFPTLSERSNIVVMVDEAHRSNYDFVDGFARHLRDALPNATYIGFTGTPIESSDRSTRQVFGDYIDVYDATQAVEDGATVKVFYEPRLAKVEIPKDALRDVDESFSEATAGTEEEAQERLKSRWAKVEAIIGSDERVKELAADIVQHWEARREVLSGKALIVAMSRRIAVKLYDEIVTLRPDWHSDSDDEGVIKVVITGSAADDESMQPHLRNKKQRTALKLRAKNPKSTLELVIVRDMWLTGFDSPSMHTMYVDKPMRGAPLMQAITRVNRSFKDKPSGLVVDYIGIADDLKAALGDYTHRDRENDELGQDLREQAIPAMLEKHEVVCNILHDFDWRGRLTDGSPKAYLRAVTATTDYLLGQHPGPESKPCTADEPCVKCRFMAQTRRLLALYATCVPDGAALAIRDDVAFFEALRGTISKMEGSDREASDPNAELDTAIKQIVSDAMSGSGVIDIYDEAGLSKPDISLINDEFIERVAKSDKPNLQIQMLKKLLSEEIGRIGKRRLVTGRQFSEMLEQCLLRYQNRTLDTAEVIAELVQLALDLRLEGDAAANEGLSEDELAFYEAIRTNDAAVLELGDATLKKIAHELLVIVRRDAKTDWNVKEQVRAKLRSTIRRLLLKYGYPPDFEPHATDLVIQQAEVLAGDALDAD